MGYWNSRGLRGSAFEELINFTNEIYRRNGLADHMIIAEGVHGLGH